MSPWMPLSRLAVLDQHWKYPVTWRFVLPLGRRYGLVVVRRDRHPRPVPPLEPAEPWVRPVVKPGDYAVPPRRAAGQA